MGVSEVCLDGVWACQMSGVGRCNIDEQQINKYYGRYSFIAFSSSGLPQAKYGGVWNLDGVLGCLTVSVSERFWQMSGVGRCNIN